MKKVSRKFISILLCIVLVVSSCGLTAFALTRDKKNNDTNTVETKQETKSDNDKISKDETVYVLANSDGTVKKIIVSDWIKNSLKSSSVEDKSDLTDIENVKGDETYTLNGDNMRVWDAQGNDIYYQGNIEKDIPVNISISYTLDGEKISPDALAGKSGHVVVRFDYDNTIFTTANIGGKEEQINVPFVMLTGMLLDSDIFRNVNITNGKIINDGDHTAVIGLALPGMQNNLNISKDEFEIPDYVEISADVEDFELSTTMTIATNDIFNEIDTDNLNSIDDLDNALNQLTNAMSQLMDGSSKLYDGLCTLLSKSSELIDGIDQLVNGVTALNDGAIALDSGATELKAGSSQLSEGLNTLTSNNDQLNGGAKQVFDTLLKTASGEIAKAGLEIPELTIENYASVLNEIISSLDESNVYNIALNEVTKVVNKQRPLITTLVTQSVKQNVTKQVTEVIKQQVREQVTASVKDTVMDSVIKTVTNNAMDLNSYNAALESGKLDDNTKNAVESATNEQMASQSVVNQIESLTNKKMLTKEIIEKINATVKEKMKSDEVKAIIDENVELKLQQLIAQAMSSDTVQEKLQAASEGAKQIIALKASLDSYNQFYLGLLTYTAGVETAAQGASALDNGISTLKDGTSTLRGGVNQLYDGVLQMKDNAPALITGVTQLKDGAMQLSDGLKEFNEKGIQKLVDAFSGDIQTLLDRVRATFDASKEYKSFTGIDSEMDGKVKFIYRTDSIEK